MKKWIYFAGPLFTQGELLLNNHFAGKLRKAGFQVFLPQEDTNQRGTGDWGGVNLMLSESVHHMVMPFMRTEPKISTDGITYFPFGEDIQDVILKKVLDMKEKLGLNI